MEAGVCYRPRQASGGGFMDPNRMTQKCQEALHEAQGLAVRRGHQEVDVEHVLAALLGQADGLVPRLLRKMDVPVEAVRAAMNRS